MSTSLHPRSHNQDTALGPKSRAEFERSKAVTPGGSMRAATYFAPHPPYAASGSGSWVTDVDGRRIFDCANNFFSLIHGHAFPPVVAALHDVIDARHGLRPADSAANPTSAEELRRRAPRARAGPLRQLRHRSRHVRRQGGARHHRPAGDRQVRGRLSRRLRSRRGQPRFDTRQLGERPSRPACLTPRARRLRSPRTRSSCASTSRSSAARSCRSTPSPGGRAARSAGIARRHGAGERRVLRGAAGMLPQVRHPADPGRGRLLPPGSRRRTGCFGLEPDLVALAKIIGGGLPIGAVAGPARHMAVFDHTRGKPPVSHGGTFSANPAVHGGGRRGDARLRRRGGRPPQPDGRGLAPGRQRGLRPARPAGAGDGLRLAVPPASLDRRRSPTIAAASRRRCRRRLSPPSSSACSSAAICSHPTARARCRRR